MGWPERSHEPQLSKSTTPGSQGEQETLVGLTSRDLNALNTIAVTRGSYETSMAAKHKLRPTVTYNQTLSHDRPTTSQRGNAGLHVENVVLPFPSHISYSFTNGYHGTTVKLSPGNVENVKMLFLHAVHELLHCQNVDDSHVTRPHTASRSLWPKRKPSITDDAHCSTGQAGSSKLHITADNLMGRTPTFQQS